MGFGFDSIRGVFNRATDNPVSEFVADKLDSVDDHVNDTFNAAMERAPEVRDGLRDGAVTTWNQVPFNEQAESAMGAAADRIPFGNVATASARALAGQENIHLDADAIELIRDDPKPTATSCQIKGFSSTRLFNLAVSLYHWKVRNGHN